MNLDLYRKRAGTFGVGSKEESKINDFVNSANKVWDKTISSYSLLAPSRRGNDVKLYDRFMVEVEARGVFNYNIEYTRARLKENQERCFLESGSVEVGYYVNKVEANETYIVEYLNQDKHLFADAFIRKCNADLNFMDANGKIQSFPCLYKLSSLTDVGTTENKNIEIVSGDAYVKVQYNEFTSNFSNMDGIRFIFSKDECYTLKNSYTKIENGLVYLKLEQSEIDFDNDVIVDVGGIPKWVANYNTRDIIEMSIDQNDSTITNVDTLQLSTQILKNNEVYIAGVLWTSSNETAVTVDSNGLVSGVSNGVSTIEATLDGNSTITATVEVTVANLAVDNYSIAINPNVDSLLLTESVTINTLLLNNGVILPDTFTYSVVGGTVDSIDDYELTVLSGNSFKLKNNNNTGNVIVRCTSGVHTVDKTYELKWFT